MEEAAPEGAVRARFADDAICALLPGMNAEDAYRLAEEVLERLTRGPGDLLRVDAGVAGYPEHGENAGELLSAAFKALSTAKRVGGSGIVAAR
jgi:GGDEF domain-containing protein